jgi:DNA invertase Pin-like site-specific DNA recombinase
LQRAAIDAWCASAGAEVVEEIRDFNRSGGTLTRPGLAKAREMLATGIADGIVVARSDRASRRTLDGLGLIDELERSGHWIAAADGTIDTTTRTGRMATTMHFAMGQSEHERFREQSAIIHRNAIIVKGRHMGPTPFGYRRGEDGRLVPHEEEAEIVRMIFGRRADGAGWVTLARELEALGVRRATGQLLNPNALRRMVKRRVYVGEAVHGEHVKTGAHEAIVSPGLWAAANRVVPTVRSAPRVSRVHEESLLRGLVRCSGCRYVLKRQPQRAAPPQWVCRTVHGSRDATHVCEAPVRLSGRQGEDVERMAIARFFALAAGMVAERHDGDDIDTLERRLAEAEALLDELGTLEQRLALGAARWSRLVAQARDAAESAANALQGARLRSRTTGGVDTATLEEAWAGMTPSERQEALGSVVQAVVVDRGGGELGDRVHVVPLWEPIDLPRRGEPGFIARPWRPGER